MKLKWVLLFLRMIIFKEKLTMTNNLKFNNKELYQIIKYGISEEEALRQLFLIKNPPAHARLLKPVTINDGILKLTAAEEEAMISIFQDTAKKRRSQTFIPASGAASRMFKSLYKFIMLPEDMEVRQIEKAAKEGDMDAEEVMEFLSHIERFPFFCELKKQKKDSIPGLHSGFCQIKSLLKYILLSEGLGLSVLPKGIIPFHRYDGENRTSFEEHLIKASSHLASSEGVTRVHFTVGHNHEEKFRKIFEKVKNIYERRYNTSFEVTFSYQKPATDTISLDKNGEILKDEKGNIVFRPGGHGALIENLNDLNGDIVFIRNIDNIVYDWLKPLVVRWDNILGGVLASIEKQVKDNVNKLKSGVKKEEIEEILSFCSAKLNIAVPDEVYAMPAPKAVSWLIEKLNRPIRVCGMVFNSGESGGAPFWIQDSSGRKSIQIIEEPQVDKNNKDQLKIWQSSSYFNPVDIVCGVTDYRGKPFDLRCYVDHNASFVTRKSYDGQDIQTLEHPGLWNGAMSDWLSIFVEVPAETFNPVKTVTDLLRRAHQPNLDNNDNRKD